MTKEDFRKIMQSHGWQKGIGDDYRKACIGEQAIVIQRRSDGTLACRFFANAWFSLRDVELSHMLDAFDEQKRKGEEKQ